MKHKLTHKDEVKGGKDSHMHGKKMHKEHEGKESKKMEKHEHKKKK